MKTTNGNNGIPSYNLETNGFKSKVNGTNRMTLDSNVGGANRDVDLNQSISALPEIENESIKMRNNSEMHFSRQPQYNLGGLKSAIPAPASLSSGEHSISNGMLKPLKLNTTNGEDLFTSNQSTQDLDNLCELEDSDDCETPTISDTKGLSSSITRVTRV